MKSAESMEEIIKALHQKKHQLRSSLGPSPKRSDLREELNAQMNELESLRIQNQKIKLAEQKAKQDAEKARNFANERSLQAIRFKQESIQRGKEIQGLKHELAILR